MDLSTSDGRMSMEQKVALVQFMEDHIAFARGLSLRYEEKIQLQSLWEVLAEQLNSLGPKKSSTRWRRTWFDLKLNTRRKSSQFKKLRQKTTGNTLQTQLTELDKKIIEIISQEAANDSKNTKEKVLKSKKKNEPQIHTKLEPAPPLEEHDYCGPNSNNTKEEISQVTTPTNETLFVTQVPSCSNDSVAPNKTIWKITNVRSQTPSSEEPNPNSSGSVKFTSRKKKKSVRGKESDECLEDSKKLCEAKVNETIILLGENVREMNENMKEINTNIKQTNNLLKTLIDVIKNK